MARTKYVIHKEYGPIILSQLAKHSDIIRPEKCASAGFFWIDIDPKYEYGMNVVCFGESISLKIKSRPEDAKQIKALILDVEPYLLTE
jgi:hypothetical protein